MDGRESPLQELQQKLQEVQRNPVIPKEPYWKKLQDNCNRMSAEQIQWTMAQEPVKRAYATMQQAFTNFLFEKYKDEFASIPSLQSFADAYVDAVLQTSVKYVDRTTQLEEELKQTRKELEELKNARGFETNGIGHSGRETD